jgi:hypothetical protein
MELNEQITKIKTMMGINENKQVYPYSCAMLYFNPDTITELHNKINPDDLYTEEEGFGLEPESHCTLLYGLHDNEVSIDDIINVLNKYTYTNCKAHNLSCFNSPKYDVLKYDIMGDNLNDTNEELKQFPFTSDYPDYYPHMTIAYLKPGKGNDYINMLGDEHNEMIMTPQYAVYSRTDGAKHKIPVRLQ